MEHIAVLAGSVMAGVQSLIIPSVPEHALHPVGIKHGTDRTGAARA